MLTACATRPPATAFDRPVTHALPAATDDPAATALAPLEAAHPDESAVRLLPSGTDALQTRIALARAATKTLDMQYYIANEDNTGKLLLGAALYAADRGVRVRMLVDDLNFKDIDQIMAALELARQHRDSRVQSVRQRAAELRPSARRTSSRRSAISRAACTTSR